MVDSLSVDCLCSSQIELFATSVVRLCKLKRLMENIHIHYIYIHIYIIYRLYIEREREREEKKEEKGAASSKNEFFTTSFGHWSFSREFILN